jgi:hypothetical protein
VNFDPLIRRIRCLGHILNLSLQAFLFATSKEALLAAIAASEQGSLEDAESQLHKDFEENAELRISDESELLSEPTISTTSARGKRRGGGKAVHASASTLTGWGFTSALRKLHDIAKALRRSSILLDYWIKEVGRLLPTDNATRWNSWFRVIEVAVEKKTHIVAFCHQHSDQVNELSPHDWDILKKTYEFLQPFYYATLAAEKNSASLHQTLVLMDLLFTHYEQLAVCLNTSFSGPY